MQSLRSQPAVASSAPEQESAAMSVDPRDHSDLEHIASATEEALARNRNLRQENCLLNTRLDDLLELAAVTESAAAAAAPTEFYIGDGAAECPGTDSEAEELVCMLGSSSQSRHPEIDRDDSDRESVAHTRACTMSSDNLTATPAASIDWYELDSEDERWQKHTRRSPLAIEAADVGHDSNEQLPKARAINAESHDSAAAAIDEKAKRARLASESPSSQANFKLALEGVKSSKGVSAREFLSGQSHRRSKEPAEARAMAGSGGFQKIAAESAGAEVQRLVERVQQAEKARAAEAQESNRQLKAARAEVRQLQVELAAQRAKFLGNSTEQIWSPRTLSEAESKFPGLKRKFESPGFVYSALREGRANVASAELGLAQCRQQLARLRSLKGKKDSASKLDERLRVVGLLERAEAAEAENKKLRKKLKVVEKHQSDLNEGKDRVKNCEALLLALQEQLKRSKLAEVSAVEAHKATQATAEAKITSLQKQNTLLESEKQQLQSLLQIQQGDNQARQKVASAEPVVPEVQQLVRELEEERVRAKAAESSHHEELKRATGAQRESEALVKELQTSLFEQLQRGKEFMEASAQKSADMKNELEAARSRANSLEQESATLAERLKQEQEMRNRLDSQSQKTSAAAQTQAERADKLELDLAGAKQAAAWNHQSAEKLQLAMEELAQLRAQAANADAETSRLQGALAEESAAKAEVSATTNAMSGELKVSRARAAVLEKEASTLRDRLKAETDAHALTQVRCQDLSRKATEQADAAKKLRGAAEQLRGAAEELQQARSRATDAEAKVAHLQASLAQAQTAEARAVEDAKKACAAETAEVQRLHESDKAEVQQLRSEMARREAEKDAYYRHRTNNVAASRDQDLKQARSRVADAEAEMARVQANLAIAREAQHKAVEDAKAECAAELAEVQRLRDEDKAEVQRLRSEMARREAEKESQKCACGSDLVCLQCSERRHRDQVKRLSEAEMAEVQRLRAALSQPHANSVPHRWRHGARETNAPCQRDSDRCVCGKLRVKGWIYCHQCTERRAAGQVTTSDPRGGNQEIMQVSTAPAPAATSMPWNKLPSVGSWRLPKLGRCSAVAVHLAKKAAIEKKRPSIIDDRSGHAGSPLRSERHPTNPQRYPSTPQRGRASSFTRIQEHGSRQSSRHRSKPPAMPSVPVTLFGDWRVRPSVTPWQGLPRAGTAQFEDVAQAILAERRAVQSFLSGSQSRVGSRAGSRPSSAAATPTSTRSSLARSGFLLGAVDPVQQVCFRPSVGSWFVSLPWGPALSESGSGGGGAVATAEAAASVAAAAEAAAAAATPKCETSSESDQTSEQLSAHCPCGHIFTPDDEHFCPRCGKRRQADKHGRHPLALHFAARDGDVSAVHLLLLAGADPSTTDDRGIAPLHLAAEGGHEEVVRELLAKGADPNAATIGTNETTNGITAMHAAACRGHLVIVRLLLSARARPGMARGDGVTPLHFAAQAGHMAVSSALLGAGAPTDAASVGGFTPLHDAAQGGWSDVIACIVAFRADVDVLAEGGTTALHMAAREGHNDAVSKLLARGAAPDAVSAGGFTAMHDAAYSGNLETVELLLRAHASPHPAAEDGATPLLLAAQAGHAEVAVRLATSGANGAVGPRLISSALRLASNHGHMEVVAALRRLRGERGSLASRSSTGGRTSLRSSPQELSRVHSPCSRPGTRDGPAHARGSSHRSASRRSADGRSRLRECSPAGITCGGGDASPSRHKAGRAGRPKSIEFMPQRR